MEERVCGARLLTVAGASDVAILTFLAAGCAAVETSLASLSLSLSSLLLLLASLLELEDTAAVRTFLALLLAGLGFVAFAAMMRFVRKKLSMGLS
ncbi:uncharacterized protein IWZ02DRAFT_443457 [Phyllosticta citriasiana]|uniref:uncharacterized protein n=1 Tax=Phyllosticta citriasiana TaxID=595635 RepID=UPI0030FDAB7D